MKDKNIAAILAFFFGWMGAHKFYLGQIGSGVVYLAFSWTAIPLFVSFIEFIILALMDKDEFQRRFNGSHSLGASPVVSFLQITLPLLRPSLAVATILTTVYTVNNFNAIWLMTQGGPLRSTTSLVLLMYEEGFRWWRLGMASALAFTLLLITLVFTLLQMRLQKERA